MSDPDDVASPGLPDELAGLYERLPLEAKASICASQLLERARNRRLPPAIYLELTSACNLNCVMCPTQRPSVRRYRPDGFMDPELFRRLVDEIAAEDPRTRVGLHKDGEPMLHPQLLELVEYASSRLENVHLITNGTLMDEQNARALLATRLGTLRFSVDGLTRKTFEAVRRQSEGNPYADPRVRVDYDSVHQNILRFCRLRRELGSRAPRVGVRVTDFDATRNELDGYRRYWEQHVDFVEVARLLSWSGQVGPSPVADSARYPCMALWSQLVVSWDGTLLPCCVYVDASGQRKGRLADVKRGSLREAASSPLVLRLRRAHLDGELERDAPFCVSCGDWRSPTAVGAAVWSESTKSALRPHCSETDSSASPAAGPESAL